MGKIPQVAPYSGDIFAIVARSASGRSRNPGPKYSTNFPTTPCLRNISVTVSTKSVAVAPSRNRPVSFTPTTNGMSIDTGCPRIAASASIPPTPHPPPPTPPPQPIDHGGMAVGADQGVGVGDALAGGLVNEHDPGEVFEIDLMHDAGVGRDNGEITKPGLAPAQERVTLLISLEFEQCVHLEGVGSAELVDLHGGIDDQFDRLQRIDQRRIGTEGL